MMANAQNSVTVASNVNASSDSSAAVNIVQMSSSSFVMQNDELSETYVQQPTGKRIFKIIVIGDSNVGKTCLTFRFCSGRFPEKTEATIGVDFREKWVDIGDEKIKVSFLCE